MRDSTRSIVIFGVASLAAVAAGCVAMAESGVAPSSWLRSVVAWVVGAGLAAVLARRAVPRRASAGAVIVGTGALIATLFTAGIDGVQRWLDVGPLHIHVAALFLPAVIVGLTAIGISRPIGVAVTIVTAMVLLVQPDASQLTAFAVAVSIFLARSGLSRHLRVSGILGMVFFAIGGWTQPDRLEPVAEVEQIFTMCVAVSPFLALIAGLALAATALVPLLLSSTMDDRGRGALALCAYFVAVSIAPFVGSFPVPLVGLGMSFPIGWWLGVGLLLAIAYFGRGAA